ncbi:MAG: STM4012 family radical SAM protein [Archangium sp.]|nr:STM4012 family radical SAM protein [Archangium sp.]
MLPAPKPLSEVWANEDKRALSLYLHVPFCEMRCGFCNLFTVAGPLEPVMERFVSTLEREGRVVRDALGTFGVSRVTIGGGTPSLLAAPLLARVLDVAEKTLGAKLQEVPFCSEVSPETSTPERIKLLVDRGVDRISIGVQSFLDAETKALARPQKREEVNAALDLIRTCGPETLNIDLIYGIEGQTAQSFIASIDEALRWTPEELYLYPLYVRPKTFLGKGQRAWDDFRLELYRVGREHLLGKGYRQISMRCFRGPHAPAPFGPAKAPGGDGVGREYRCQDDGMIGLGVGARSYTKTLHYSSEWAVSPNAVRGIIESWNQRDEASFGQVFHGIELDEHEQRRRHLILSLLAEGLDAADYARKFAGRDAASDFPELAQLIAHGFVKRTATDGWELTAAGLERSDQVGPWLQSKTVTAAMKDYTVR